MHRTTAPSVPVSSQAGLLIAMGSFTSHGLRWPSLSQKMMTALLKHMVAPFESHAASDGVWTTALAHGNGSVVSSSDMSGNSREGAGCGAPTCCPTSLCPTFLFPTNGTKGRTLGATGVVTSMAERTYTEARSGRAPKDRAA